MFLERVCEYNCSFSGVSTFSNCSFKTEAGGLIQNLHHPDLDPVRIVREEIDKTALRRIILPAFDRENPLPETLAGILPMSFPHIFLSGDGCLTLIEPGFLLPVTHRGGSLRPPLLE